MPRPFTVVPHVTCPKPAAVPLQVCDTGCGISIIDQAQVFEKYQSGAGCQQKGTGLGLYLSQKLVTLMGGNINIMSPWVEGIHAAAAQGCVPPLPDPATQKCEHVQGAMFYFNLTFPMCNAIDVPGSPDESPHELPKGM